MHFQTGLCRIVEFPEVDHGGIAALCQRLSARHTHCCHHLCAHKWTAMFLTPPRSKKSVPFMGQESMSFLDVWVQNYLGTTLPKHEKCRAARGHLKLWMLAMSHRSCLHVHASRLGVDFGKGPSWLMDEQISHFGVWGCILCSGCLSHP